MKFQDLEILAEQKKLKIEIVDMGERTKSR